MSRNNSLGWFMESAVDRKGNPITADNTDSYFVRVYKDGEEPTSFNEAYEKLCQDYKDRMQIDIKKDINKMVQNAGFMTEFKKNLLGKMQTAFAEAYPNDPHIRSLNREAGKFWDHKVKSYMESTAMPAFLPISTLEFPVLVKQFYSSVLSNIIEIESVNTPNMTKHIRTTLMVDNNTGDEYEYPKCLWDGTWEKIYDASRGLKIPEDVVDLDEGRLYKFDIVKMAGGVRPLDQMSYNIRIIAIKVDGDVIRLPGNAITVEFSTNGTLVNGDLNFDYNGTQIDDVISGQVDFKNGVVSLSCANGTIEGVVFSGYLSNEKNMRNVSVREERQLLRFVIEDGPKYNMPFTIEDIEDASALLDVNYYNRMVDEIIRVQSMEEEMSVIKFLNDEFLKFNGVTTDTYKLESLAMTFDVDLAAPAYYAGDPFTYMTRAVHFKLSAIVNQIMEMTKMNDLSFVIVGNPMACMLLKEHVIWKSTQGTSIGGIDVNNSYGLVTDMGANIRVVSTNIYDAYTMDAYGEGSAAQRELKLHIYSYPTNAEHISFRHLKYTSHVMTSQSQTAYQNMQSPGGAYNIVTATSRYKSIVVQGIQALLVMMHSNLVYGKAPAVGAAITGAPWRQLDAIGQYTPPTEGGGTPPVVNPPVGP